MITKLSSTTTKPHFLYFLVDILLIIFSNVSNPVVTIHVSATNVPLDGAMATFPPVCPKLTSVRRNC